MREKLGLWIAAVALLSFFVVLVPTQAFAQLQQPLPTPDPGCTAQDKTFANNVNSAMQGKIINANTIAKQYPIKSAIDACTTGIATALSTLTGLMSPFDSTDGAIIKALINTLLTSLISSVCSIAIGEIQSITSNIEQFATVCLPIPSLGLGFGGLGLPPCLGTGLSGMQIPLLTSPTTGQNGPQTGIMSYFGQH